jgi:hypothetical protein
LGSRSRLHCVQDKVDRDISVCRTSTINDLASCSHSLT